MKNDKAKVSVNEHMGDKNVVFSSVKELSFFR